MFLSVQRLLFIFAVTAAVCSSASAFARKLEEARIEDLFPTQGVIGFKEVTRKRYEISKKRSNGKLKKYLKEKFVPVVRGPEGKLYMIDHHHTTQAFYLEGQETVYIEVIEDFSKLSEKEFWEKMIKKKWCWLLDENGNGPIDPKELPKTLKDLKDDPYRTLAGMVKDAGGFEDKDIPYYEFYWAQAFRKLELLENGGEELTEIDYVRAVEEALIHIRAGLKPEDPLAHNRCFGQLASVFRRLKKHYF